jgi:hypothetical protein
VRKKDEGGKPSKESLSELSVRGAKIIKIASATRAERSKAFQWQHRCGKSEQLMEAAWKHARVIPPLLLSVELSATSTLESQNRR